MKSKILAFLGTWFLMHVFTMCAFLTNGLVHLAIYPGYKYINPLLYSLVFTTFLTVLYTISHRVFDSLIPYPRISSDQNERIANVHLGSWATSFLSIFAVNYLLNEKAFNIVRYSSMENWAGLTIALIVFFFATIICDFVYGRLSLDTGWWERYKPLKDILVKEVEGFGWVYLLVFVVTVINFWFGGLQHLYLGFGFSIINPIIYSLVMTVFITTLYRIGFDVTLSLYPRHVSDAAFSGMMLTFFGITSTNYFLGVSGLGIADYVLLGNKALGVLSVLFYLFTAGFASAFYYVAVDKE